MQSVPVAIRDVLPEHATESALAQNEQLVEALTPSAAQEALAGGVLPGSAVDGGYCCVVSE